MTNRTSPLLPGAAPLHPREDRTCRAEVLGRVSDHPSLDEFLVRTSKVRPEKAGASPRSANLTGEASRPHGPTVLQGPDMPTAEVRGRVFCGHPEAAQARACAQGTKNPRGSPATGQHPRTPAHGQERQGPPASRVHDTIHPALRAGGRPGAGRDGDGWRNTAPPIVWMLTLHCKPSHDAVAIIHGDARPTQAVHVATFPGNTTTGVAEPHRVGKGKVVRADHTLPPILAERPLHRRDGEGHPRRQGLIEDPAGANGR